MTCGEGPRLFSKTRWDVIIMGMPIGKPAMPPMNMGAVAGANGTTPVKGSSCDTPPPVQAPPVSAGGAAAPADAAKAASTVAGAAGGGPTDQSAPVLDAQLGAILTSLVEVLTQLVALVQAMAGGTVAQGSGTGTTTPPTNTSGGGGTTTTPPADTNTPPAGGGTNTMPDMPGMDMPTPTPAPAPTPAPTPAPAPAPTPAPTPVSYSVSTPNGGKWVGKPAELDQLKALPGVQLTPNY